MSEWDHNIKRSKIIYKFQLKIRIRYTAIQISIYSKRVQEKRRIPAHSISRVISDLLTTKHEMSSLFQHARFDMHTARIFNTLPLRLAVDLARFSSGTWLLVELNLGKEHALRTANSGSLTTKPPTRKPGIIPG